MNATTTNTAVPPERRVASEDHQPADVGDPDCFCRRGEFPAFGKNAMGIQCEVAEHGDIDAKQRRVVPGHAVAARLPGRGIRMNTQPASKAHSQYR